MFMRFPGKGYFKSFLGKPLPQLLQSPAAQSGPVCYHVIGKQ
jgi:hypothetical protein